MFYRISIHQSKNALRQGHIDAMGSARQFCQIYRYKSPHPTSIIRVILVMFDWPRRGDRFTIQQQPFQMTLNCFYNLMQGFIERFTRTEATGEIRHGHAIVTFSIFMHNH